MARMKKKINKNRMNKKNVQAKQAFTGLKHDMQQLMAEEGYVDAIDVMAEMATNRQMDGEVMYWGAQCYFMTGDFARAERWVSNALNNGYNSASLKILLATLCMTEERDEEGFELCEAALTEGMGEMTSQEKEIFDEFMDNIRYGYDELAAKYPKLNAYLQQTKDNSETDSAISKLKQLMNHEAEAETAPAEPAKAEPAENTNEDKAQAALARLRQLLSKNKAAEEQQAETVQEQDGTTITREVIAAETSAESESTQSESKPPEAAPTAEQLETQQLQTEEKSVTAEEATAADKLVEEFDTAGILAQIAAKEVSLAEKIRLLNVFAGGCYQSGDYQSAFDLLSAALELDGQDGTTLKNIAYTCLSAGEKEQALSFAAKLPAVDFGLLYALKN